MLPSEQTILKNFLYNLKIVDPELVEKIESLTTECEALKTDCSNIQANSTENPLGAAIQMLDQNLERVCSFINGHASHNGELRSLLFMAEVAKFRVLDEKRKLVMRTPELEDVSFYLEAEEDDFEYEEEDES